MTELIPLMRLLAKARAVAETAHTKYGIHPGIFLVLYLGTWPPYAYGLLKTLWALAHREVVGTLLWASFTFVIFLLPYAYVLVWGKNLPRWARPGVILLIVILIGWQAYRVIAN